jgi:hypothetical protein
MKRSVTIKVRVENGRLFWGTEYNEHSDVGTMRSHGLLFPASGYKVTYRLNPSGEWIVGSSFGVQDVRPFGTERTELSWFNVCFLPEEWIGRRVSREVKS